MSFNLTTDSPAMWELSTLTTEVYPANRPTHGFCLEMHQVLREGQGLGLDLGLSRRTCP